MATFVFRGVTLKALETLGITATLAVEQSRDRTPVAQGRELYLTYLTFKATSLVGLGLATILGMSVLAPVRRVPSAVRQYTALRSQHAVLGRWINGESLRFEEEVAASPSGLARDARKIAKERAGRISPEVVVDQALLVLLDGKPAAAATVLEQGLRRSPSDTSLLNDLAVVDLVRADQGDSYNLILALDALERCLRIQPNLREALFNRALVLERLSLKSPARDAWATYIEWKEEGPWLEIARSHLAHVEEPSLEQEWRIASSALRKAADLGEAEQVASLVARFPQPSRILVQEDILINWAKARISGDGEGASRELRVGKRIGEALLLLNGEHSATDAIVEIENAEARSMGGELAQGYLAFGEGLKAYQKLQPQKAFPLLSRARKVFTSIQCPSVLLWTDFWLAGTNYYLGHRTIAETEFGKLLSSSMVSRYPALRGRALWSLGLTRVVRSEFSLALQNYRVALTEFERLGELENAGAVQALMAEDLRYLGEVKQAWQVRTLALVKLASFPSSVRLHNVLSDAADELVSSGLPAVARHFHSEDFEVSRRIGTPATIAEALLGRSRDLFSLGHVVDAWADMREARNRIADIPDDPTRRRFEADASLAAGEFADAVTARGLTTELSRAVAYYDGNKISTLAALARLVRARALLLLDQNVEAEFDFRTAVTLHEEAVGSIDDPEARTVYRKQWQPVFDKIIELQVVQRNDPEGAFSSLEYARSGQSQNLRYTTVQQYLQSGDVFVEYALLPDRLLLWILRAESVDFVSTQLDGRHLDHLVDRFTNDLQESASAESLRRTGSNLFEALARPILNRAPASKRWIVVPDRSLEQIPFAGLFDRQTGRFLVEDRVLVYEPNAAHFVTSHQKTKISDTEHVKTWSLVVIGNPTPDRKLYPALTDLPGAESEAREVAALYSQKTLLIGKQATRGALLRALKWSNAVHFAGHASFSKEDPLSSRLFLALDQKMGSESVLYASDLTRLNLGHINLFILSACETAPGGGSVREGLPGFASSLLAAGVSGVLAARWQISDQRSRELLVDLHRRFLAGQSGGEAVWGMQVASIEAGDDPRIWAAFSFFGDSRYRK